MIDYSPFWKTLELSQENWYTLTNRHHLSHSTLHRLKHNKDISTKTLNDLCTILHCSVQDILQFIPNEQDQTLHFPEEETELTFHILTENTSPDE